MYRATASSPWSGPVRDRTGRALVLKIHDGTAGTDGERLALEAARGPALVELVASDPTANALLLARLDPSHTLLDFGADEACEVIGGLVAEISSHPAPPELRSLADEADRLRTSITAMLDRTPDVLRRALADRAIETLEDAAARVGSDPGPLTVVHGDLHYENVLHTLPDQPARWVGIDPLPVAGYPEWEVAPVIGNRWDDAAATGDPERALCRRFDIVCERAALDRLLAQAVLHAVAVDNVLWLARATDVGPLVGSFLHAYSVVARW